MEERLCRNYHDFARLINVPPPIGGGDGGGSKKKKKRSAGSAEESGPPVPSGPHPPVFFITIEDGVQPAAQGYPAYAPAIAHDKAFQSMFSNAGNIASQLLAGSAVELVHDPDWKEFPEIGESLKRAGAPEECYALAMCP